MAFLWDSGIPMGFLQGLCRNSMGFEEDFFRTSSIDLNRKIS